MMVLALLAGLLPPTIAGWLALRLLEARTPVLRRAERLLCGFSLGITLCMFAVFALMNITGMPLEWWTILATEVALIVALLVVTLRFPAMLTSPLAEHGHAPRWACMTLGFLLVWTVAKILAGGAIAFTTPAYYTDTLNNWNYRAKVYAHLHTIPLALPPDTSPSSLSSYPPTVPLIKADLALIAGTWNDGLADLPHVLWFLACGGVLWYLLRRHMNRAWALLGVIVYWSLPLALQHGVNAYADVFLSLHYLCLVHFLLIALGGRTTEERLSGLRLAALPLALLPFVKNEGFALFLPVGIALLVGVTAMLIRQKTVGLRNLRVPALVLGGLLLAILVPWTFYKVSNGLTFGNAKSLADLGLGWQPFVVNAVAVNTFLEGNWLLLFPFLALLLARNARTLHRSSAVLFLTVAGFLPFFIQFALFLFTSLSSEATQQTGYARGLVQIVPVFVALAVLLLEKTIVESKVSSSGEGK